MFALADLHWTQLFYLFLPNFQIANKIVSLKFPNNRRLERVVFHKFFLSVPQQPKKAILAKANIREGFLFQNSEAQKLIITNICPHLQILIKNC